MCLYNCGGRSEGMRYIFFSPSLEDIYFVGWRFVVLRNPDQFCPGVKVVIILTAFWTRHMTETVFENRQPVSRRGNVVLTFLKVSSVITGVLLWCIGGKKVDIRCKEGKRSGFLFQCACANFSSSNENPG